MAALETAGADLEKGWRQTAAERGSGVGEEVKVNNLERDCRICHLGLVSNSNEFGVGIELGCCCKNDLSTAHKHCAEAWFKIRGNKTCEICHSIVRNVMVVREPEQTEQLHESNNGTVSTATVAASVAATPSGGRSFWHVHRVLNFLLACMVFAFVISWLFHFNVPS
ncbi:uncharacterized protein LOC120074413 [Benincasa hispida]|uniref:uncharacterized protein LOC120074413 n=1 Tax=Benincasa hispida TaxID=102211 RepID=UPI001900E87C|nr:uncharacterized protein LOC120074413 [Benincasa hispida]